MSIIDWFKRKFGNTKSAEIIQLPPTPKTPVTAPHPAETTPGKILGIDVSHWEDVQDWNKVAAAGYKFMFCKATEGISYTDKTFKQYVEGARKAGLLVGVYHFLNNGPSGADQAKHFLDKISGIPLDLPVVMDWEVDDALDEAKAFLKAMEDAGRKVMIYGGNKVRKQNLGSEYLKYPLWFCQYNSVANKIPKPWSKYTIWQYADDGKVPGIKGDVDLNVFNGTIEELKGL